MNKKLYKLMNWPQIEAVVYAEETDPFNILGPHIVGNSVLFQMFYPNAQTVKLIISNGKTDKEYPMECADESGFFAALVPGKIPSSYVYEVNVNDKLIVIKDAYAFEGFEIPEDIGTKINKGKLDNLYEYLGSHTLSINGTEGVKFALWAPNALKVSVVGDFNDFDGRVHSMKFNRETGIHELFIPGIKEGARYLYEIKTKNSVFLKTDPFAQKMEYNGKNCSIVYKSDYTFADGKYMDSRKSELNRPISIYEVHASSMAPFGKNMFLSYKEMADVLLKHVLKCGYTHVMFLPLSEYSDESSLGFNTMGYFAVSSRFGSPDDFKYLVDTLHQNDIGVILNWTGAFFATDEKGLRNFDGTCLYEHLDPKKGIHPEFGTHIFNYGRANVSNFLISNVLYWIKEFHIDGIRLDSVSSMIYLDYKRADGEWIANMYGGNENLEAIEFLKTLNMAVKKNSVNTLMIASDDSGYPGLTAPIFEDGLGFDFKLNLGMMDDLLDYVSYDPYFRSHHHNELTASMLYQYTDKYIIPFSFDRFVEGNCSLLMRMSGEDNDKFNNLKLFLAYSFCHPGRKLFFEGIDTATESVLKAHEVYSNQNISSPSNKGVFKLVCDLNKLYKTYPALSVLDDYSEGFEWINCIDSDKCMLSFLRKTEDENETLLVVCNFANVEQKFTVGIPLAGKYKEILNTDSKDYNGKNRINRNAKTVSEIEADGLPFSIDVKAAPLSVSIFKYVPFTEKEKYVISKKKEAAIARTKASEYKALAEEAQKEYFEAKKRMDDAVRDMNLAQLKKEEALANEKEEILRAERAVKDADEA